MNNRPIPFSFELVFILWIGITTAFSLLPVPEVGAPEKSDKIAHFIMYLITCGVFYFTFRLRIKKIILWAGVFSFAYGLLMELVQGILPYREFSLEDLFANTAGVVLMLLYLVARDNLKSS
ncbi:hypothetical protein HKBW3S43_01133 [Candidatus Hakubella thermalkaliphila]|uniref:VanZ-like domain-containing protein n=3 Tax=Candidatus Hakubella thermalkaliphila TaxID=2754717 RepID=A0A6V8P0V8_9ACTN|nr:VanZ family protein [Candidatus Hakubella thermalkaliphila]GFP25380.1 hypothetical protein HKBW3S25_00852 [Candidatus Hakubella thermalkaliphila]GFP28094.1 hypothetical protein HKBW3S33_01511 [Candidatus Hakubella thermalkaliphila]GFP35341.1 hypothetical protein HKBW3S43_01133 [Candidatus Hakubella thermalkaliphila]GFP43806.1 hypothetical protein HKBW3C_02936 [Candidatus Hakubella thermalkaliphila]